MFPLNPNTNNQNGPFGIEFIPHEQNPNSCLLNYPSHLLHDDELLFNSILHHQTPPPPPAQMEKEGEVVENRDQQVLVEKGGGKRRRRAVGERGRKAGNKDRHSKITTASGTRDRRMRLSLHIARKFFDLQDMLGFDKASKTIEWLFNHSKSAIKELTATHNHYSSSSCRSSSSTATNVNSECIVPKERDGNKKGGAAREIREKARVRARERTREKMINNDNNNNSCGEISKKPPTSIDHDTCTNPDPNPNGRSTSQDHPVGSMGIIEKLFAMSANPSIFDHDESSHRHYYSSGGARTEEDFGNFQGNWGADSTASYGYGELTSISNLIIGGNGSGGGSGSNNHGGLYKNPSCVLMATDSGLYLHRPTQGLENHRQSCISVNNVNHNNNNA